MENQGKATEKQLAYIQHLRRTQGKESAELDEDLSFQDASKMISDLILQRHIYPIPLLTSPLKGEELEKLP